MRNLLRSPKFITISLAIFALFVIPLTLIEVQQQQSIQQHASTTPWQSDQSASSAVTSGNAANIAVTFTNAEAPGASTEMHVIATDKQTGKSIDMGTINGGQTVTSSIPTGRNSLTPGQVTFSLTWANGQTGTTTTTANYNGCGPQPTPTTKVPTPTVGKPTPTPTPLPSGMPTPTICPTLGPVQNVKIICPNCQLKQQ